MTASCLFGVQQDLHPHAIHENYAYTSMKLKGDLVFLLPNILICDLVITLFLYLLLLRVPFSCKKPSDAFIALPHFSASEGGFDVLAASLV
ncbi:hypothetical protein K1719_000441 [Acacia pycnantha]|nr:hypothetical protein K1719_000441 [Acacia pycnantha]